MKKHMFSALVCQLILLTVIFLFFTSQSVRASSESCSSPQTSVSSEQSPPSSKTLPDATGVSVKFPEKWVLYRYQSPLRNFFKENGGTAEGNQDDSSFIEEEAEKDQPKLIRSSDLENRHVMLEIDFLYKDYKDTQKPYTATPMLLRVDTGKNTEIRLSSDFYTWQKPYKGINDITLGAKWNFHEGNPNLGLLAAVEFPSGVKGIKAAGYQPGFLFLMDYNINKKWVYSINTGMVSNVDGKSKLRYSQFVYVSGFTCHINQKNDIFALFAGKTPDKKPGGVHLTGAVLGYRYNPAPGTQLNLHVTRGLSGRDLRWEYGFGIGQRF